MNKVSKVGPVRSAKGAGKSARKRTADVGYARGRETRQRIIDIALDDFGRDGFEQASTRAIAEKAGVNLGALTYYFGSKEGLYRACAEHIAESIEARAKPTWDRMETALQDETLSRRDLLDLLRGLVEFAGGDAFDRKSPHSWVLFIARETIEPGIVSKIFYERLTHRSIRTLAGLIARITDCAPDAPDSIIQAISLIGHFVTLGRMRPVMLRELGWDDLAEGRSERVKSIVWNHIEAGLLATAKSAD